MSLSTVLSGGYAFDRRCIWKMYWWAMGASEGSPCATMSLDAA